MRLASVLAAALTALPLAAASIPEGGALIVPEQAISTLRSPSGRRNQRLIRIEKTAATNIERGSHRQSERARHRRPAACRY